MKTWKIFIIVLKITEFVSLTFAATNIGYFIRATRGEDKDFSWDPLNLKQNGRLEFFLFTTTVGVFIVMAMILMLATGLQEKISENQTVTEIHAVWALMLLVSSVQLLRTMNDLNSQDSGFDNVSTCDSYRDAGYKCRQLMAGVVQIRSCHSALLRKTRVSF